MHRSFSSSFCKPWFIYKGIFFQYSIWMASTCPNINTTFSYLFSLRKRKVFINGWELLWKVVESASTLYFVFVFHFCITSNSILQNVKYWIFYRWIRTKQFFLLMFVDFFDNDFTLFDYIIMAIHLIIQGFDPSIKNIPMIHVSNLCLFHRN